MTAIIELNDVCKDYNQLGNTQTVLVDINLTLFTGEFVAIVGESGNGKSTLLNLLTGIDSPTRGEIMVGRAFLHQMKPEQLSRWRCSNIGIVFQFFQLLPALSLLQNVILPMDFANTLTPRERKEKAMHLLNRFNLAAFAHRLPSQVSGGQQQRTAIARALANNPPIIFADEPTGNLDEATAQSVFDLFCQLRHEGKTIVMVTHNPILAQATSRQIEIRNGRILSDSRQSM
jgi:putative ABC transport system ATP-binding protein